MLHLSILLLPPGMLGIEPGVSDVLDKRFTTELYPASFLLFIVLRQDFIKFH